MSTSYVRYPSSEAGIPTYPLLAPDGTAAAPSFAFTNAASTGLYKFGANSLGFSTNGLTAGHIDASQNWTVVGTLAASNLSGTNTGDQTITLTGPVTGSGTGSFATTIGASQVTDGNLATSYVKADGSRALSAGWDTTQVVQFKGVTSGSAAAAGYVSEQIQGFSGGGGSPAFVSAGSTGQFFDIASASLTAGRWLVVGTAEAKTNGATITEISMGIGTATGNSGTGLINGYTFFDIPLPISTDASGNSLSVLVNIGATTTYYLKGFASFSVATPQARGTITAIRLP